MCLEPSLACDTVSIVNLMCCHSPFGDCDAVGVSSIGRHRKKKSPKTKKGDNYISSDLIKSSLIENHYKMVEIQLYITTGYPGALIP
jgi:hypothetical protein